MLLLVLDPMVIQTTLLRPAMILTWLIMQGYEGPKFEREA